VESNSGIKHNFQVPGVGISEWSQLLKIHDGVESEWSRPR